MSDDAVPVYALSGRLVLSKSGWLLLEVPNSVVHGFFAALHVPGIELPRHTDGSFNAHISVMRREEVDKIGAKNITETVRIFKYQVGELREVRPLSWDGVSKVWFLTVKSPELEMLRKSYGLSALPKKGDRTLSFHITVAIRKTKVLYENEITKIACEDATEELMEKVFIDGFVDSGEQEART